MSAHQKLFPALQAACSAGKSGVGTSPKTLSSVQGPATHDRKWHHHDDRVDPTKSLTEEDTV